MPSQGHRLRCVSLFLADSLAKEKETRRKPEWCAKSSSREPMLSTHATVLADSLAKEMEM